MRFTKQNKNIYHKYVFKQGVIFCIDYGIP